MHGFKKFLVTLDLSNMDDLLIDYVGFLANTFNPDQVIFMHVMETMNLSEEVSQMFDDLDEPIDEIIKKELNEKIENNFNGPDNTKVELRVKEGNPTDVILHQAEAEETDLAVIGKKTGFKGKGILAGKLIRLLHSSILVVPETTRNQLDKILTPIDFSRHSEMALEKALKISHSSKGQVICQHVYSLPKRYFPYIPSKKVGKSIEEEAQKDYKKFLKKAGKQKENLDCIFSMDEGEDIGQRIYDEAIKLKADLIVIGSKGLTDTASYLIGSTAEKLTTHDKSVPLLIVKDKKESLNFFKALMEQFST